MLILLFIDPKLDFIYKKSIDLKSHLYIDRSLSMSYHSQPSMSSLVSGVDKIIGKIKKKDIPLKIYGFGSEIDTNWISGNKSINEGSTNIGQVIEHIQLHQNELVNAIIITDGQANLGAEIQNENSNLVTPIHIIGVGDKTPLVDISIHSIDAPPVIIKGENAILDILISSHGEIKQKLNVMLYSGRKLLGSKIVPVTGGGSLEKVRFLINPSQSGEILYKVQVNALSEEINILNNKQIVPIHVLKDEYNIALITGAPNFNTGVIKKILSQNSAYKIDHFVSQLNGYSPPIKIFWDTKYDLILFDNHPTELNSKEWESYLRIFAKKILSQKTSFGLIAGYDIDEGAFNSYLSLMDLSLKDPLINLGDKYNWSFNKNWNSFFPFQKLDLVQINSNELPPLFINLEVDSSNAISLANFSISKVKVPLMIVAEKPPLRSLVWSSTDLNSLYYKNRENLLQDLLYRIFNPVFSWLMRTGNEKDYYFRTNKNSFQQGERVTITGKPIRDQEIAAKGFIHISNNNTRINSKPIKYNFNTGLYTGQFWASQAGKLDYEIELIYADETLKVSEGSIQVQESQIELNNVYLNSDPLIKLTELTKGSFYTWSNRFSILEILDKKSKDQKIRRRIVLHNNRWYFSSIILLLLSEWILRKRLGMM